eukprot:SM000211S06653  [mRNA]  locus=s211:200781:207284:- [translate_table: standard]
MAEPVDVDAETRRAAELGLLSQRSCRRLGHQEKGIADSFRRQTVSCHWRRQRLAVVDARDRVLLYDLDDQDKAAQPSVLGHEFQRQVAAVAWRPRAGQSLATACRSGVSLWVVSGRGQVTAGHWGRAKHSTGLLADAKMTFLQSESATPVTSLTWSPCGQYPKPPCLPWVSNVATTRQHCDQDIVVNDNINVMLYSSSTSSPTFTVWDVASGFGEPLRRGFAGVSLVEWSPSGDYLFSAHTDATFHIWETTTWTSELWSSVHGNVVSARWSSSGKVILAAFESATTLAAIHLAGQPPSLDATLIPVDLPELDPVAGPAASAHQIGIERMAWDPSGQRLAVNARTGDASTDGMIAIYDARTAPIISVSFIGFLRGHDPYAKPISFNFFEKIRWGALLAVEKCRYNQDLWVINAVTNATLIPVDLPELDAVAGPAASAHQYMSYSISGAVCRIGIERMAWDPTGQRLAVNARTGDASADGLIAIYDTRTAPIVSVSFIGFLRGHDPHAKPISFAFFEKIRWGALLAVHWSTGRCCFYPLLFGTS